MTKKMSEHSALLSSLSRDLGGRVRGTAEAKMLSTSATPVAAAEGDGAAGGNFSLPQDERAVVPPL